MIRDPGLYGMIAEFSSAEALIRAATSCRNDGYRRIEAYSPSPMQELTDALGRPWKNRVALWVLIGGFFGVLSALGLQVYSSAIAYPIDVGGRPLLSWLAYVPVSFELTVLGGSFFGIFGFLLGCRLPRLHHPIFEAQGFERVTLDRHFLCIRSEDPRFDRERISRALLGLGALKVSEVRTGEESE